MGFRNQQLLEANVVGEGSAHPFSVAHAGVGGSQTGPVLPLVDKIVRLEQLTWGSGPGNLLSGTADTNELVVLGLSLCLKRRGEGGGRSKRSFQLYEAVILDPSNLAEGKAFASPPPAPMRPQPCPATGAP